MLVEQDFSAAACFPLKGHMGRSAHKIVPTTLFLFLFFIECTGIVSHMAIAPRKTCKMVTGDSARYRRHPVPEVTLGLLVPVYST
ncbi:hypothetical protein DPMN_008267 [Dreissena polymorpha]|uniref:Uncharacterized protein n=1 Tax=Dreissena polymorpha TaxID=45954 RepID=A0A9D4MXR3_DREPO|nr:hypothetical protein DPMN_008267 [Dreissena polymorpha]